MLLAGRKPDDVAGMDFAHRPAPSLRPASKVPRAARSRAGSGASMIGSCHTVPVNQSADIRREGVDPAGRSSMTISFGFRFLCSPDEAHKGVFYARLRGLCEIRERRFRITLSLHAGYVLTPWRSGGPRPRRASGAG